MKDFISRLTWVDCIALLAVIRGCYVGYKSGFFPELLRIAAYLVTVIVAFHFHEPLGRFLTLNTFLNEVTAQAAALILLLVAVFLVTKLATLLLLRMLKVGEGAFVYRLVGALAGACRWVILLSLVFMLVDRLPLAPLRTDIHDRSVTGPKIAVIAPTLFDFLSNISPQLTVPKQGA